MNSNEIKILAIESSCDETAAAVVVNGRDVRSNVISSQIALHTLYGGVVPEIASRKHIEKINQVIGQALSDAGMTLDDMDAIGVTYGPGLVGALLVGVAEAKAISYAKKLLPPSLSGISLSLHDSMQGFCVRQASQPLPRTHNTSRKQTLPPGPSPEK